MTGEPDEPPDVPGGRLHVERVEVVVLADAVRGGFAVEARERPCQDGQLLAGVVADDADLGADARAFRIQRQRHRLHVAQPGRVVTIDAEVVHRVAIDGVQLDFLPVLEHRGRHHRSGRDDVPVGQDQAALGVDHETRRLARLVPLGVEGAGLVDLDRDDRRRDALERTVPRRALGGGRATDEAQGQPRQQQRVDESSAQADAGARQPSGHSSRPYAALKRCLNSFMSKR